MQRIFLKIALLCTVTFCAVENSSAQQRSTIVKLPNIYLPTKILSGDTTKIHTFKTDSIILPGSGSQQFTPKHDSNYVAAFQLALPAASRFRSTAQQFLHGFLREQQAAESSVYSRIANNLDIPANVLKPSAVERTSYEHHIRQSMRVPYVRNLVGFGAEADVPLVTPFQPLNELYRLLGIRGQDQENQGDARSWDKKYGLTIPYSLEKAMTVSITILSTQSDTIVAFLKKEETAGEHTFTWDGRDSSGRAMPAGDYIAEIRFADERFLRRKMIIHETAR
ncbi:MAG TPA: FlgD immunoglobulin-like domain containing protein [Patescibacteria group bacterium]|nr:FlgD immunoglobulin-like domain containing protein [Patescibacteria group bacterium]